MADEKRRRWPYLAAVAVVAAVGALGIERVYYAARAAVERVYREDVMRRSVLAPEVPRQVWREIKAFDGLDSVSVLSLIYAESRGKPGAKAQDGGLGLGQIMPDVARRYHYKHEEMLDPVKNARVTCLHFKASMISWHSNERNAVAGWNVGVRGWTQQLRDGTVPEPTRKLLERYGETKRRLTRWMKTGEVSPD